MKDNGMRSFEQSFMRRHEQSHVLAAVKKEKNYQVLDLSNCSAPFTGISISCVSVHKKVAESQTGDNRVDPVTLHKIIWKSEIFWE